MCVEVVHHKMPLGDRQRAFHRFANVPGEILFGACAACGYLPDLPGADIEIHDKRGRSMPNVLEFPAFDFAWSHWQAWMFAFQRLNASHFVRAHHGFAFFCQFWSLVIQLIDVFNLLIEPFILFFVRRQPVTDQVRLETPFLSSRDAWRGEMLAKIPRCTISSAISLPVHWLIGLPDFSGFASHLLNLADLVGCDLCWRPWPRQVLQPLLDTQLV